VNTTELLLRFPLALLLVFSCAADRAVAEDGRLEPSQYLLAHNYSVQADSEVISCYHLEKCRTREVVQVAGKDKRGRDVIEKKTITECPSEDKNKHICEVIN